MVPQSRTNERISCYFIGYEGGIGQIVVALESTVGTLISALSRAARKVKLVNRQCRPDEPEISSSKPFTEHEVLHGPALQHIPNLACAIHTLFYIHRVGKVIESKNWVVASLLLSELLAETLKNLYSITSILSLKDRMNQKSNFQAAAAVCVVPGAAASLRSAGWRRLRLYLWDGRLSRARTYNITVMSGTFQPIKL
ncbi:DHHC-type zinc finger family protein [Striga asiatica]|uniref:DHHC-type zinc finger family protein n=1 Tax=Striga asiatica TaxID=4170 RepID=A0A5A7QV87_STRAF|nr:DHHC-type zinc finger family protein [Striga asiatica]